MYFLENGKAPARKVDMWFPCFGKYDGHATAELNLWRREDFYSCQVEEEPELFLRAIYCFGFLQWKYSTFVNLFENRLWLVMI